MYKKNVVGIGTEIKIFKKELALEAANSLVFFFFYNKFIWMIFVYKIMIASRCVWKKEHKVKGSWTCKFWKVVADDQLEPFVGPNHEAKEEPSGEWLLGL